MSEHPRANAAIPSDHCSTRLEPLEPRVLLSATTPKVRMQSSSAVEGSVGAPGTMVFRVVRTGSTAGRSVVRYQTVELANPNAAQEGTDYTAVTGRVAFRPGKRVRFIGVPLIGDGAVNNDLNFAVRISRLKNARVGPAYGVGTILDDDGAAGTGRLAINDANVVEGDSGTKPINFTVTLSRAAAGNVTVKYKTTQIGGSKNAQPGEDYISKSGTLTFAAGETSKTITIQVVNDTAPAQSLVERFFVDIFDPTGATITDSRAEGLITDNDIA